jgi:PAS domain S-box-containing protein
VLVNMDKKTLLLHAQVSLLFNAIPYSAVANLTGYALVYGMFRDAVTPLRLYGWISLLVLITSCRLLHYRAFRLAAPGPEAIVRWYHGFRIGALVLAGGVGSAGFLLFVYDSSTHQMMLALMLVCIAAFAITTMAPSADLLVAFLLLLLCPLTGSLFLTLYGMSGYAIWIMPITIVMLLISSLRMSRNISSNIELTIEAQRRERDLQSTRQRLSVYFRDTPLAVLEWDDEMRILQWNPAAARMFGFTQREARGKRIPELIATSNSSAQLVQLWSMLEDRDGGQQLILQNRNKQGSLLQCEWFNTLLTTNGGDVRAVSLVQDVTQRLENERIKQEFVSIVSHELRTPVTSIKGTLGLLASGVMDDEPRKSREMLNVALENTNRLHMLVNDILDVNKLESGRFDYHMQQVDVVKLIGQLLIANEALAQQYLVSLRTRSLPATCMVSADPARLLQVLTNILANAVKFSEPGGIVTVAMQLDDSTVRISVHNRGEVIPPEDRALLFTKFYQRDSSATRAKGGTGLGLYICQKILEDHGSQLDFTSNAEEGTTFFFSLVVTG